MKEFFALTGFNYLLPELILVLGIICVLIAGLSFPDKTKLLNWLSVIFLGLNLVLCFQASPQLNSFFSNQIKLNSGIYPFRLLVAFAGLMVNFSFSLPKIKKLKLEYLLLALSLQLGSQLTIMAGHAITLLLSLELMSLSSYALAGYHFSEKSSEAGMKYFISGSSATALMAFGFSLLFGHTGSLELSNISEQLTSVEPSGIFLIGFVLILSALLFKLSAAPLHFWVPDVFQTTPKSVLALFSTLPKVAVIGLMTQMITSAPSLTYFWTTVMVTLSIVTLCVGNLPALWQTNAQRMMGYSAIAQAGFLLAGLCIAPEIQSKVTSFYAFTLVVAATLVFICLEWFEQLNGASDIKDFGGLGRFYPIPAFGLTVGLLSLTGLPPFAGFSAKLLVFISIWQSHPDLSFPILSLIVFGILNTVIALFYYIKMPYQLFLKSCAQPEYTNNKKSIDKIDFLILFLSVFLILFFLFPDLFNLFFIKG